MIHAAASSATRRALAPLLTKSSRVGGIFSHASSFSLKTVGGTVNSLVGVRSFSAAAPTGVSIGQELTELASALPYKDVLFYEPRPGKETPIKFTLDDVNHFSNALASGLLELGFIPGDKVLSWLPLDIAETVVLQFTCSKAGFVLYQLDSNVTKASALADALEKTEANILVTQEFGADTNYIRLIEEAVPELIAYDARDGIPFFTPRFPHLRMTIHDAYDQKGKLGMTPYHHLYVPDGPVEKQIKRLGEDSGESIELSSLSPVVGDIESDKVLTNEEVLKSKLWPEVSSVLNKEFLSISYAKKNSY